MKEQLAGDCPCVGLNLCINRMCFASIETPAPTSCNVRAPPNCSYNNLCASQLHGMGKDNIGCNWVFYSIIQSISLFGKVCISGRPKYTILMTEYSYSIAANGIFNKVGVYQSIGTNMPVLNTKKLASLGLLQSHGILDSEWYSCVRGKIPT